MKLKEGIIKMNDNMQTQQRNFGTREIPKATEVFYANGVNVDINPTELVLTFDQSLPASVPQAKSIVLNANAIYQLRDAFNNMIEVHEENLEAMAKNEQRRN